MKKIFLILFVLLFLLPMPVWVQGADKICYVATTGSNTSPYETWAKAATTPKTCVDYVLSQAVSSGHKIYIAPGTYDISALMNLSSANAANLLITGALGVTTEDASELVRDTVVLGGASASTTFYVASDGQAGMTFKNFTIKYNGTDRRAFRFDSATTNLILQNLVIEGKPGTGYVAPIKLTNATGFLIDKCRIRSGEVASGESVIWFAGTSAGTIQRSLIEGLNGDTGIYAGGILCASSGEVNIFNNEINSTGSTAINQTGSGTTVVTNNKLHGYGVAAITRSAGTITATNNAIWPSPASTLPSGRAFGAGVTDGGGNVIGGTVSQMTAGRGGYIIIATDDSTSSGKSLVVADGTGNTLEEKLASYGMSGTWFIYGHPGTINWSTTANKAVLQGLVSRGTIEIGSHTWSHTDVRSTVTTFYTMSHSGGTTKQYKIDRANHKFGVKIDADEYLQDYVDGVTTFATLWANIQAHDAGTWTLNTPAVLTSTQVKISSLNATTGNDYVDLSTAMTFDKSTTDCSSGFYADEIAGVKTIIEGWIGSITDPQTGTTYACNSFAEPGGAQDADSVAAVTAAGYLGSRPVTSIYHGAYGENLLSQHLYGIEVITGVGSPTNYWYAATSTDTVKNINIIAAHAAQTGRVWALLAHGGEIPATGDNSWETVLSTLKKWQDTGLIKVMSMQKVIAELKATPWSYADGVSTRTYTTYSDYRLSSGSPAINAGVDVGLTTDYLGNPVRGIPDIGAYEYQGFTGRSSSGFGLGFTFGYGFSPGAETYRFLLETGDRLTLENGQLLLTEEAL